MKEVRTRFAPSPTGDLHVGNLRTAIFNWLFARQNCGKFFLRIEDTDQARSKKQYEKTMLNALNWIGLDVDLFEGDVVRQSQRLGIYERFAEELVEKKFAFYCQCQRQEETEEPQTYEVIRCECRERNLGSGAIKFKVLPGKTQFKDIVFGEIRVDNESIEDFVLLRSDRSPTYGLAVVIDDHLMEISHVIRGEDHRTNTFKQLLLYAAFGWEVPVFAHLPMIKGTDGKKLSKRNGDASVLDLQKKGYLSEAVFNILLKLGWGSGNEEIVSKTKALKIFSFDGVRKAPSTFETKKLENFSGFYLRNCYKLSLVIEEFVKKFGSIEPWEEQVIESLYREVAKRSSTALDFVDTFSFLRNIEKNSELMERVSGLDWNDLANSIKDLSTDDRKKIRLFLTGKDVGLPLDLILKSLGKDRILNQKSL